MKITKTLQLKLDGNQNKSLEISLGPEKFFVPISLNPKKLHNLKTLKNETEKFKYIMSIAGIKSKIDIKRPESFNDPLRYRDNHFLNLLKSRSNNTDFKRPFTNDFHFGIEIECFIPNDSLDVSDYSSDQSSMMPCCDCEETGRLDVTHRASGYETEITCPFCEGSGEVENEDYDGDSDESAGIEALQDYLKEKGIRGLHVKGDGSIDADSRCFAVEIACLTTDFKNLEKLCKELSNLDARVNKSCGLHVHLDMRGKNKEQLEVIELNLKKSLDVLFSCVPESRRESNYCVKRVSTDKYSAFNTGHLNNYGTIECRLHSGSTDFNKIKNWCLVLKSIVDKQDVENSSVNNIYRFCKYFKLDKSLKSWLESRYEKFSGPIETEHSDLEESEAS